MPCTDICVGVHRHWFTINHSKWRCIHEHHKVGDHFSFTTLWGHLGWFSLQCSTVENVWRRAGERRVPWLFYWEYWQPFLVSVTSGMSLSTCLTLLIILLALTTGPVSWVFSFSSQILGSIIFVEFLIFDYRWEEDFIIYCFPDLTFSVIQFVRRSFLVLRWLPFYSITYLRSPEINLSHPVRYLVAALEVLFVNESDICVSHFPLFDGILQFSLFGLVSPGDIRQLYLSSLRTAWSRIWNIL